MIIQNNPSIWSSDLEIKDISKDQVNHLIHGLEMILEEYPSCDPSQLVNKRDARHVAEIQAMLAVLRPK